MALLPDYDTFAAGFEAGANQVVYTRIAADLDTPVSLMLKLSGAGRNAFMLESVTGGEVRGRYSIIGMNPDLIWECRGTQSRINRTARYDDTAFEACTLAPLAALRALLAESRIDLPASLPAAAAGLFGYLGYDMIRLIEHLPDINPDPLDLPDAVMVRPSVVAVLDGVKGDVILVAPAYVNAGLSARAAYAQAAERVMDAQRALERPMPSESRNLSDPAPEAPPAQAAEPDAPARAISLLSNAPRNISGRVTSFRWCPHSAGRRIFANRPLRSTGRCGGPIPRPSCSFSISATFR